MATILNQLDLKKYNLDNYEFEELISEETIQKRVEEIGKEIAKRSLKKGIKSVAFDKGKYKYHGIIKILADSARNAGLDF